MTGKTVVFIVGFDEKLVLRSGFRVGLQPGDTALLIYSLSGGDYERGKVQNAVKTVNKVFESAGVTVKELVLDARDFGEDVANVVKVLRELNPRNIVVVLGSGMRYLGVVALYASLIYRELVDDAEIHVHVAREDGLYDVLLSAETLKLSIGPSELKILCFVQENAVRDVLVRKAAEVLGKSYSTIYAVLARMQKRGLVELANNTVSPTPLGDAVAKSMCGVSRDER